MSCPVLIEASENGNMENEPYVYRFEHYYNDDNIQASRSVALFTPLLLPLNLTNA